MESKIYQHIKLAKGSSQRKPSCKSNVMGCGVISSVPSPLYSYSWRVLQQVHSSPPSRVSRAIAIYFQLLLICTWELWFSDLVFFWPKKCFMMNWEFLKLDKFTRHALHTVNTENKANSKICVWKHSWSWPVTTDVTVRSQISYRGQLSGQTGSWDAYILLCSHSKRTLQVSVEQQKSSGSLSCSKH